MSDFDPARHIIQLRGRGGMADYLPVAARIAWFRDRHPDGAMTIEAHTLSEQIAIFRARVSIPNGGSAEGWGSETPQDFKDYIEKASTKALGRALAALGFGTLQTGEELDEGPRIVDAPQTPAAAPQRTERPKPAPRTDADLLAIAGDPDALRDRRVHAAKVYLSRADNPFDVEARAQHLRGKLDIALVTELRDLWLATLAERQAAPAEAGQPAGVAG